jgi:hypothetical protein
MPVKSRIIDVECRCGQKLFHYQKIGPGQLIKCYLSRILSDNVGISPHIEIGTEVFCPDCRNRIGTIYGIKGVRAVKLNQGQIRPFRL